MHYTSSEKRMQHKIIEASVDSLSAVLDNANPETTPITKRRLELYHKLISRLVIPNVNHGWVSIPDSIANAEENYIPIWTTDPDEALYLRRKYTLPTPEQVDAIDNIIDVDDWRQQLSTLESASTYELSEDQHAACFYNIMTAEPDDDSNAPQIYGRPFVILNNTDFKQNPRPHTVAHELTHVDQVLSQPCKLIDTYGDYWDISLAMELGAYSAEADYCDESHHQNTVLNIAESSPVRNESAWLIRATTQDHATVDETGHVQFNAKQRKKIAEELRKIGRGHIAPNIYKSFMARARSFGED